MRVSRAQAEKNHQNVINEASRLFRQKGFDGVGLKDLMKGAGLTQGGFYKQFASKEDLIAKACQRAMEMATERWSDAIAANPDAALEAIIGFYLSIDHSEDKSEGCPLVALGGDAARHGPEVKASLEAGVNSHIETLQDVVSPVRDARSREKAMVMMSLMAGAVLMSRTVNDAALAQGCLSAAADEVRRIAAA